MFYSDRMGQTGYWDFEVKVETLRIQGLFPSSYDIEITSEITARAPVPELTIGVKQAGFLIGDELTVQPGTPLDMEIYLDDASKDVYGVMVSAMEVTDTKTQSEVLVLNGYANEQ